MKGRMRSNGHYSVREVSMHWRVNHKTVLKLIDAGTLVAHRVGRVWRIAPEEIQRYERDQARPRS